MNTEASLKLKNIYTLWQQGNTIKAEALCRQILNQYPNMADAIHLLGLLRKQSNDLIEAQSLLSRSIELAPNRADFFTNLANLYRKIGKLNEAEHEYSKALSLVPNFRPAKIGLMRLLNSSNSLENAEKVVEIAQAQLKINKQDAETLAELGQALRMLGRLLEAEQAYRQALLFKPDFAIVRHNLGALLTQLLRADEALHEFNRAEKLGIGNHELYYNRAAALLELGQYSDAESAFLAAINANPLAPRPQLALANLRFMQGASNYLSEVTNTLKKYPHHPGLWALLGTLLRDSQGAQAAISALKQGIEQCGISTELLSVLATTLQDAGHNNEALSAAYEAYHLNPQSQELTAILVSALLGNGRADEAMILIHQLRRDYPLNQEYIAYEATAARLLNSPLYEFLYDYAGLVKVYELDPPTGWNHINDFLQDLVDALHQRHKFNSHPITQSLRAGTQTGASLLTDADTTIQALLRTLHIPIADYRSNIGNDPSHPLKSRNHGTTKLTGCWSVRLHKQGFHVNHIHPQGWLSSAFYVQTPEEVADTRKKNGWLKLGEPRFFVPGATPEKFVQPKPGRLVLFPSYMWHGTMPILGDSQRLTVAFDAVTQ